MYIEFPAKLLDHFLRSNKSNINQYKWFPQNGDCTNRQIYAGSITSIKRLQALDGVDHLLDVFQVKYIDGDSGELDEDEIRQLLCTSSVTDGALAF